jgi:hypothetical protein
MAEKHSKKIPVQPVPEKRGYEFGGPYVFPHFKLSQADICNRLGAFGIVFGLPILIYVFTFVCNDISGCPAPSLLNPSTLSLEQLKREAGWPDQGVTALYDTNVTLWTLSYYAFSLFLQVFLPGQEADGVVLACGGRLKYKFNGMAMTALSRTSHSAIRICYLTRRIKQHSPLPSLSSRASPGVPISTEPTLWCGHSYGTTMFRSLQQTY